MGVQMSELKTMVIMAAESAFLSADEKAALVGRLRKELGV
jgi:adenosine deaminase